MKLILKLLVVMAIVFAVAILTSAGFAFFLNQPPENRPEEDKVFTVDRGENVQRIADRLEREDLIRSPLFLRVLAKVKATETSFQTGSYMIPTGSSALQVHNVLVTGREILQKVTLPEGWTLSRIAERLEAAEIIARDELLLAARDKALLTRLGIAGDSAEGYIFPDTYLLPKGYSAEKVLETFIRRFFEVIDLVDPDAHALPVAELHRRVILASVIEREYVVEEEAPLMASVFLNRLSIDMPLQSCATVVYVLAEEKGREHPESLTLRDLEVESMYNTYRHSGLPPGPISNPGRTALASVFHPAESEYLFFLLKDPASGEHEFTVNYSEHLYAKNLYLKKS